MNDNTEATKEQPAARSESLVDAIATIIQAGHRDRKTSHEVAGEVVAHLGSCHLPLLKSGSGIIE